MRIIALVRCAHFILGAAMPRRAVTFSCLPKKKVTKRTTAPPAARVPCVARQAGRLRNSRDPLRGHALAVLADCPRLGCATRRRSRGPKNRNVAGDTAALRKCIVNSEKMGGGFTQGGMP